MATIEPRLIHLLNDSTTPELSNVGLPPLQGRRLATNLPLPVEPCAASALLDQPPAVAACFNATAPSDKAHVGDRALLSGLGAVASHPRRLRLDDADMVDFLNPLSKILIDDPAHAADLAHRKRHRAVNAKDDFLQLPQLMKKQKAALQQSVMPPIINGLYEPPPDAAVFPPISSGSFAEGGLGKLKGFREFAIRSSSDRAEKSLTAATSKDKVLAGKSRKRSSKPRRKWSDEETKSLLLGVKRHGVGKWTSILEDPDFCFICRNAGDLKDRFRTCCPDELRQASARSEPPDSPKSPIPEPRQIIRTGLLSENILITQAEVSPPLRYKDITSTSDPATASTCANGESDSGRQQRKSRAHRKNMTDLAELGIHGPFKKSHRRERRHFTEQEDREILQGLDEYGPAWTRIQRDDRYHLTSRQPTDLRDRVRNKYPHLYNRIEKGALPIKCGGSTDRMDPAVSIAIRSLPMTTKSVPLDVEPPMSHNAGNRDDIARLAQVHSQSDDHLAQPHHLDSGEPLPTPFIGSANEMGISRLLLDDNQTSHGTSSHHFHSDNGYIEIPVFGTMSNLNVPFEHTGTDRDRRSDGAALSDTFARRPASWIWSPAFES